MFWDLESFFIVAAAFGAKTCAMPRVMGSLAGEELARQIQANPGWVFFNRTFDGLDNSVSLFS